jgi:hypothetical protein
MMSCSATLLERKPCQSGEGSLRILALSLEIGETDNKGLIRCVHYMCQKVPTPRVKNMNLIQAIYYLVDFLPKIVIFLITFLGNPI